MADRSDITVSIGVGKDEAADLYKKYDNAKLKVNVDFIAEESISALANEIGKLSGKAKNVVINFKMPVKELKAGRIVLDSMQSDAVHIQNAMQGVANSEQQVASGASNTTAAVKEQAQAFKDVAEAADNAGDSAEESAKKSSEAVKKLAEESKKQAKAEEQAAKRRAASNRSADKRTTSPTDNAGPAKQIEDLKEQMSESEELEKNLNSVNETLKKTTESFHTVTESLSEAKGELNDLDAQLEQQRQAESEAAAAIAKFYEERKQQAEKAAEAEQKIVEEQKQQLDNSNKLNEEQKQRNEQRDQVLAQIQPKIDLINQKNSSKIFSVYEKLVHRKDVKEQFSREELDAMLSPEKAGIMHDVEEQFLQRYNKNDLIGYLGNKLDDFTADEMTYDISQYYASAIEKAKELQSNADQVKDVVNASETSAQAIETAQNAATEVVEEIKESVQEGAQIATDISDGVDGAIQETAKKKRGRPKKNKTAVAAEVKETVTEAVKEVEDIQEQIDNAVEETVTKKKRGRPKGSKAKQAIVEETKQLVEEINATETKLPETASDVVQPLRTFADIMRDLPDISSIINGKNGMFTPVFSDWNKILSASATDLEQPVVPAEKLSEATDSVAQSASAATSSVLLLADATQKLLMLPSGNNIPQVDFLDRERQTQTRPRITFNGGSLPPIKNSNALVPYYPPENIDLEYWERGITPAGENSVVSWNYDQNATQQIINQILVDAERIKAAKETAESTVSKSEEPIDVEFEVIPELLLPHGNGIPQVDFLDKERQNRMRPNITYNPPQVDNSNAIVPYYPTNNVNPVDVEFKVHVDEGQVANEANKAKEIIEDSLDDELSVGVSEGDVLRNIGAKRSDLVDRYYALDDLDSDYVSRSLKSSAFEYSDQYRNISSAWDGVSAVVREARSEMEATGDVSNDTINKLETEMSHCKKVFDSGGRIIGDRAKSIKLDIDGLFAEASKIDIDSLKPFETFQKSDGVGQQYKDAVLAIEELHRVMGERPENGGDEAYFNRLDLALQKYKTSFKDLKKARDQYVKDKNYERSLANMTVQLEKWRSAARMAGRERELDDLLKDIGSNQYSIEELSARFAVLRANVSETLTPLQKLSLSIQKLSSSFVSRSILNFARNQLRQALRQMITDVREVNKALTEFQIVSNQSDEELAKFSSDAFKSAKNISASFTDVVDAATVYSRLGYDSDESLKLSEMTTMFSRLGGIGISDAENAATAVLKAFDMKTDDLQLAMDKMVLVGNNFPISAAQIGEALNNASSALAAGGNNFDQSIALLTAANTTVQDASKSSTALRTITARIRNTKTELADLGEEVDENYNTTAKYRAELKALSGVDILDANNQFRATYDILKDLSEAWGDLGSQERAAITTQVAGTRGLNVFESLMQNFDIAKDVMDSVDDAAGFMAEKYETYTDSIEAANNRLRASWQQFSSDLLDSGLVSGLINIAASGVDFLDDYIAQPIKDIIAWIKQGSEAFNDLFFPKSAFETKSEELDNIDEKLKTLNKQVVDNLKEIARLNNEQETKGYSESLSNELSILQQQNVEYQNQIALLQQRKVAASAEMSDASAELLSGNSFKYTSLTTETASEISENGETVTKGFYRSAQASGDYTTAVQSNISTIETSQQQMDLLTLAVESGTIAFEQYTAWMLTWMRIQEDAANDLSSAITQLDKAMPYLTDPAQLASAHRAYNLGSAAMSAYTENSMGTQATFSRYLQTQAAIHMASSVAQDSWQNIMQQAIEKASSNIELPSETVNNAELGYNIVNEIPEEYRVKNLEKDGIVYTDGGARPAGRQKFLGDVNDYILSENPLTYTPKELKQPEVGYTLVTEIPEQYRVDQNRLIQNEAEEINPKSIERLGKQLAEAEGKHQKKIRTVPSGYMSGSRQTNVSGAVTRDKLKNSDPYDVQNPMEVIGYNNPALVADAIAQEEAYNAEVEAQREINESQGSFWDRLKSFVSKVSHSGDIDYISEYTNKHGALINYQSPENIVRNGLKEIDDELAFYTDALKNLDNVQDDIPIDLSYLGGGSSVSKAYAQAFLSRKIDDARSRRDYASAHSGDVLNALEALPEDVTQDEAIATVRNAFGVDKQNADLSSDVSLASMSPEVWFSEFARIYGTNPNIDFMNRQMLDANTVRQYYDKNYAGIYSTTLTRYKSNESGDLWGLFSPIFQNVAEGEAPMMSDEELTDYINNFWFTYEGIVKDIEALGDAATPLEVIRANMDKLDPKGLFFGLAQTEEEAQSLVDAIHEKQAEIYDNQVTDDFLEGIYQGWVDDLGTYLSSLDEEEFNIAAGFILDGNLKTDNGKTFTQQTAEYLEEWQNKLNASPLEMSVKIASDALEQSNEHYDGIAAAIASQNKNGYLTVDEISKLGDQYGTAFSYDGGKMRLDQEKAYQIYRLESQEAYNKATVGLLKTQQQIRAVEEDLVKEIKRAKQEGKEVDNTYSRQLQHLKLQEAQYAAIINQVNAQNSKGAAFDRAIASGRGDSAVNARRDALLGALENGIKYGQVGEGTGFDEAIDYALAGEHTGTRQEAINAQRKIKKYSAENGKGAYNVQEDLRRAGILQYQKNEDGSWARDANGHRILEIGQAADGANYSVQQMADALGVSKDYMYDLLNMMTTYGYSINYADEKWQDIVDNADDARAKYAGLLGADADEKANADKIVENIVNKAKNAKPGEVDEASIAAAYRYARDKVVAAATEGLSDPKEVEAATSKAVADFQSSLATQFGDIAGEKGINLQDIFATGEGLDLSSLEVEALLNFEVSPTPGEVNGMFPNISRTLTYVIRTVGGVDTSSKNIRAGDPRSEGNYEDRYTGSANLSGTAYIGGKWGDHFGTHKALVGEVGQELMVDPNTGTWRTIGDHGPEIINVPDDAIIFNDEQTKGILAGRGVYGRGKQSHASGTAHAAGAGGVLDLWKSSKKKKDDDKGGSSKDDGILGSEYEKDAEMLEHQIKLLSDMLNLYHEGSEEWFDQQSNIITTYSQAVELAQREYERLIKAGYDASHKDMRKLAEQIVDWQEEIFNAQQDYWDAQRDNATKTLEFLDDHIKSIVDLKEAHYDLINSLEDEGIKLQKEMQIARDAYPYLTEAERMASMTEEDYTYLLDKLSKISKEAGGMYEDYLKQIEEVGEDASYELDRITEQMQIQYDLKSKEYATAKAELGVLKARKNLENVMEEKSVATLVGGMWVWTSDSDEVKAAMEELADAEQEYAQAQRDEIQGADIATFENYSAEVQAQIDAIDEAIFSMDTLAQEVHELKDVIWAQILASLSATGKSAVEDYDTYPQTFADSAAEALSKLIAENDFSATLMSAYKSNLGRNWDAAQAAASSTSNNNSSTDNSTTVYIGDVRLDQDTSSAIIQALRQANVLYQV